MDSSDIQELISREGAVISKLLEIKSAIELHHQKCNVLKTTGASLAAAGVASTIAGVCLAPITAGVSLALTAGGIGASVAGGAGSIGTELASQLRYKKFAAELETVLTERLKMYHSIGAKIDEVMRVAVRDSVVGESSGCVGDISINDSVVSAPPRTKRKKHAVYGEGVAKQAKCISKPKTRVICVTGLHTIVAGYGSVGKLYDTSKILQFLYINREIYTISNLSASLLAKNQLSGLLIGTVRQSLNNGLVKLGTLIGFNGLKIGARTMLIGLGAVGVAWDAYGLIKAWSSKPKMWKEVEKLILAIQNKIDQLELFMRD